MSGRSDLRMYVEHLFVGRTLDAETIELKEEIYGNLVARFDDYVAQGMSEDEAYAKTCEAVTSLDDVMGEKGEGVEATTATFATAPVPEPTTVFEMPAAPKPLPVEAPKRWTAGKIAAVVVVTLVIVGAIGFFAFNMLGAPRALDDYQSQTSQNVEQVDQPDDTAHPNETSSDDPASTGQTTNGQGSGAGNGQGTGSQNGNGAAAQSGTGPTAEVQALAPKTLEGYVGTALSDGARITELARALPLGSYLTEATGDASSGTLTLTYQYENRDYVAHDDDHIDRALVFDVAALMCTMGDVNTVSVIEIEDDGWDYDRDLYVFERSSVERLLGVSLTSDQLAATSWTALRDMVMSERYWDPIWERAERD